MVSEREERRAKVADHTVLCTEMFQRRLFTDPCDQITKQARLVELAL